MRILFCKISSMKYYKGACEKDIPQFGGKFVEENGYGHEEFNFMPNADMSEEIKTIGSSLVSIAQGIEKLRSDKTYFHGKIEGDYVLSDSMYVYFIVNSVCTVGLFLRSFYNRHYPKQQDVENEFSISSEDLPF